jgi:hypothetical protein
MNQLGIKTKLTAFINCDKFKVYQHLQPAVENSTSDTITLINTLFNDSAKQLQDLIDHKSYNEQSVKDILLETASKVENEQLDTEDFEFGFELIAVLSEITGVGIEAELNKQQEEALSPDAMLEMLKKAGLDPKDFGL